MVDRYTSCRPRDRALAHTAIADPGRVSRHDMITAYRRWHQKALEDARRALDLTDDELIVETYIGVHTRRGLEEVDHG